MYPGRMASSCINAMSRRDHSVGITAAPPMIVLSRISRHYLLLSMYDPRLFYLHYGFRSGLNRSYHWITFQVFALMAEYSFAHWTTNGK